MKNIFKILIALTLFVAVFVSLPACNLIKKEDKKTDDPLVIEDWTVAYQYDLTPYIEIEKSDYVGISYTVLSADVTDDEITAELDALSEKYATYTETIDRGAQNGDRITLDYKGFIDGEELENGAAEGDQFLLGESSFIPGFQEGIVGHKTGETFTVDATFPEDYGVEELNGKTAQFEMTLQKIEEVSYPTVNDEFIADKTDYKTVEEYKAYVKEYLTEEKETQNATTQRNQAYSSVYSNVTIKDWPQEEVDKYFNEFTDMYKNLATSYSMEFETLLAMLGSSLEEFNEYAEQYAQSAVETDMIMFSIAKNENLISGLTKADYDAYVEEIAEEYEVSVEEFLENNTSENIWRGLVGEQAMDFIINNGIAK